MREMSFRLAGTDVPIILVEARINDGEPLNFVLDTGNGTPFPLLVTPSLIRQLGLTPAENGTPLPCVQLERFEFAGEVRAKVEACVMEEIEPIVAKLGNNVVGNIGHSYLKHWRVIIDYATNRLRFTESRPVWGEPFRLGSGNGLILLPVEVNGRGPYCFVLDTGASTSVVSPRLAAELGLSGKVSEALGISGPLEAQELLLPSLRAGGQIVHDSAAAVIDIFDYTSQGAGTTVDGILGYSFLKEFQVEIDYPACRLDLSRPPS